MNVPSRPLTITEVISSTFRVDSWRSAPERPSLWQTTHSDSKITIPFTDGEVTAGGSGSDDGGTGGEVTAGGSGSEDGGGSGSGSGTSGSGSEDDGGGGSGSDDGGGGSGSGSGTSGSGSEDGGGTTGSGSVVGTTGAEATGVSVEAEALVVGAWVAGAASAPSRSSGSGPGWEVPGPSAAVVTSVGAEVSGAALYAVAGAEVA